jgi:hypothetical protein
MELHRFPPNAEADRAAAHTAPVERIASLTSTRSASYVTASEDAPGRSDEPQSCAAPRMWRGQPTKDRCHLAPGHHGPHQIGDEDFALVGWTARAERHDEIELATAI